jgi:membrane protein YqaA with SNARE-associated domain
MMLANKLEGPYKEKIESTEKYILWLLWWVGLGVLSSVGLGTGLHTFLIYLGPHIAQVTLAAYECGTTDFPSPPYPDSILCPDNEKTSNAGVMTIWSIMSKVRIESFCWGVGTALGELPPYFMARAHRLSGYDPDEDQEDEFLELQQRNPDELNTFDRAKLGIERLVERVGFFGILHCASIPNPLFDLAGITCGHFLVPFWTFFGATVIGKAVIKMHIQKLFIIFAFNETLIAGAVSHIHRIPWIGQKLEAPFKEFLAKQKDKLHRKSEAASGNPSPAALSWFFEKLALVLIIYYVTSILNSLAQAHHSRIRKQRKYMK